MNGGSEAGVGKGGCPTNQGERSNKEYYQPRRAAPPRLLVRQAAWVEEKGSQCTKDMTTAPTLMDPAGQAAGQRKQAMGSSGGPPPWPRLRYGCRPTAVAVVRRASRDVHWRWGRLQAASRSDQT